ncbi:methyltransferase domain-containing protein [Acidobacteria bacterium AH-259-D05]|nr:methyltransferase domain-containing protein [Acidobacteria bacterium AH-259-D05]
MSISMSISLKRVVLAIVLLAGLTTVAIGGFYLWLTSFDKIVPNYSQDIKLNLGSGNRVADGWINIDISLNAKLSRYPSLRRLLYSIGVLPKQYYDVSWPPNVVRWDVTRGLPYRHNSVKYIFHSHLFEHLKFRDAMALLDESHRVLETGGVLRMVVPDLLAFAVRYIQMNCEALGPTETMPCDGIDVKASRQKAYARADKAAKDPEVSLDSPPSFLFTRSLYLFPSGALADASAFEKIFRLLSGADVHDHEWMYDYPTLAMLLRDHGFRKVESKNYLESAIEDVHLVDIKARFTDAVCIEAIK